MPSPHANFSQVFKLPLTSKLASTLFEISAKHGLFAIKLKLGN